MTYESIRDKVVTIRKAHICVWCAEEIRKGTKSRYRAYRYDGDFVSDYLHLECSDAMSKHPDIKFGLDFIRGEFKRGSIEAWIE